MLPFEFSDCLPDDLLVGLETAPKLSKVLDWNEEDAFVCVHELKLAPLLEPVLLPNLRRDGDHALTRHGCDLAQLPHHANDGATMQLSIPHCSTMSPTSRECLTKALTTQRR